MKRLIREAVLFMMPGILGTLLFYVIPFIGGLYYAVYSDTYPPKFVGFDNFDLLFRNDIFRSALWNTVRFSLLCAPVAILISLVFACCLKHNMQGRNWLRAAMLAPYVLPTAAVVSVWKVLFGFNSSISGIVNSIFGVQIDLLQSKFQLFPIMLLYTWRNTGFFTIILISAMQVIQDELYEYAELEGASAMQKHFYITVPLIAPSLLIVLLFSWTGSLKIFKEVYALSGGYPPSDLYTLQHFINNHLDKLNYSIVTSASYSFALIMIIAFAFLFLIEQRSRESIGR